MSNKPRTGVDHPFAIVPLELLTDVPATAVCVYVVLAECAHHDSGECWPSMATIADRIGKSEKAARRAVQALAESGWVTIRGAATEAGKQTSNRYFIYRTPPRNGTPTPPKNGRVIPPKNGRGSLPKMGDEPDPIEPDPYEPEKTRAPAVLSNPVGFDAFWKHAPRKIGKGAARKAWKTATKRADPNVILDAWTRYADTIQPGDDMRFVPHPATWLNQDRWEDEPDPRPLTSSERIMLL